MKKIICVMLCAVICLLCACSAGETQVEETMTKTIGENTLLTNGGKSLKLLAITSSFGVDTTDYLYEIAKAQGVEDVVVGRLYVGACTLKLHLKYGMQNTEKYEYTKNSSGQWEKTENVTMLHGLLDEDWDVIYLQQSAADSALVETYEDYIDQLIAFIDQHKTNPNAKYIWNMTWAYQGDSTFDPFVGTFNCDQMAMYNAIVAAVQEKVVGHERIAAISPTGTALQNARTSYFGDLLTRDTRHLNDVGRVIAGYALYATLADAPLTEIALTQVTPTFKLSDSNKDVILNSVNAAVKTPFAVTQSAYPD